MRTRSPPPTTTPSSSSAAALLTPLPHPTTTLTTHASEARRKYTYAAFFLLLSLISFTFQTELASYIQHDLGWDKAYCMLYLTHGSWIFLWPIQLAILRVQSRRRGQSWTKFWEGHIRTLRGLALLVETRDAAGSGVGGAGGKGVGHAGRGVRRDGGLLEYGHSPWPYLVRTTVGVTSALTVAGLSWYLAVSMTTPSDLTAIYNCSAFFAYAFSVPLLKERLRVDKMVAVAVAIVGVLVVAYGDGAAEGAPESSAKSGDAGDALDPATRFAGNLIIGAGSVLYGLYEVLYKRFACPPDGTDATKGVIFANTFGSLMGAFTLFVLWIPLPILHLLGWETFELPTGQTAWLLFISVVMNMMFSGSFLVLISLTSPVLSSVAALLTIFIVAIVDWFWTGTPLSAAAVFGGLLIIAAFAMLSWSTWREMNEEERKRQVDLSDDED
jgi:drug/metabolite transporter (DMT)-like permease